MKTDLQNTITTCQGRVKAVLQAGRSCIYPTETFFALGCNAGNPVAVKRIFNIKARPRSKPLPLIIGAFQQLESVTTEINPVIAELGERFWPGPLSILLPARSDLPEGLVNQEGLVCIRLTSHPRARSLCLDCGFPLVATSANISMRRPAISLKDIDTELTAQVGLIWDAEPRPEGRAPSTIVQLTPAKRLHILRSGVISRQSLTRAGFDVD